MKADLPPSVRAEAQRILDAEQALASAQDALASAQANFDSASRVLAGFADEASVRERLAELRDDRGRAQERVEQLGARVERLGTLTAEQRRLHEAGYRAGSDGRLLSPLDYENFKGREAIARSANEWLTLTLVAIGREATLRKEREER